MRKRFGFGKPRVLQGLGGLLAALSGFLRAIFGLLGGQMRRTQPSEPVVPSYAGLDVVRI